MQEHISLSVPGLLYICVCVYVCIYVYMIFIQAFLFLQKNWIFFFIFLQIRYVVLGMVAHGRLRQEAHHKFEAILDCITRPCLNNNNKKQNNSHVEVNILREFYNSEM